MIEYIKMWWRSLRRCPVLVPVKDTNGARCRNCRQIFYVGPRR